MDDTGILKGAISQLGQTAKQTVKQIVKLPSEMGQSVGEQLGAAKSAASAEGSGEPKQKQWQSDEERMKFLKDLYGSKDQVSSPSADAKKTSANPLVSSKDKPSEFQEQIKEKSPEEQKKLLELRGQLHRENYYDPTFNPVRKQEERPAEKVEKEKQEEMQDLQKKEAAKPQPIAVVREQNKAEMFRGAAG
jgi:hypothetical protein